MKFANATKFNRKSGEAEGSAVLLISSKDPLPIRLFIRSTLTCLLQVEGGMNIAKVDYGECKCHK